MAGFEYTSSAINALVGPVKPGVLMEFYGWSATGKTTLAAYIPIAEIAKRNLDWDDVDQSSPAKLPENGVYVVVDVDGGFSRVRLRQILEAYGLDAKEVESHLWLYNPTSFKDQHSIARTLSKRLKEEKKVPVLIVIDAIAAIYRQIVLTTDMQHRATTTGIYTGKINLQLNDTRRLAVKYGCPLIVTTWKMSAMSEAMGNEPPEFDGIGGRGLLFMPKIVIRLEAPGGIEKTGRMGVIRKHREKAPGLTRRFKLCDTGIEDA